MFFCFTHVEIHQFVNLLWSKTPFATIPWGATMPGSTTWTRGLVKRCLIQMKETGGTWWNPFFQMIMPHLRDVVISNISIKFARFFLGNIEKVKFGDEILQNSCFSFGISKTTDGWLRSSTAFCDHKHPRIPSERQNPAKPIVGRSQLVVLFEWEITLQKVHKTIISMGFGQTCDFHRFMWIMKFQTNLWPTNLCFCPVFAESWHPSWLSPQLEGTCSSVSWRNFLMHHEKRGENGGAKKTHTFCLYVWFLFQDT